MVNDQLVGIAFGAFLGAALTYLHTYMQVKVEKKEQHQAKLTALMGEILDIKQALDAGSVMGISKVRLSQSMWEECRAEIFKTPSALAETLRKLYLKVAELNCSIDYDLNHSGLGRGYFDQIIEVRSSELKDLVNSAVSSLRRYLSQIPNEE